MQDELTSVGPLEQVPFRVTPKQLHKFVGMTALCLPIVLILIPLVWPICFMTSISHFYFTPVGGDILVGGLSVIGAILLFFYTYKGNDGEDNSAYSKRNARLAKIAGLCALGVAFLPTSGLGCAYDGEAARFLIAEAGFTVPEGEPRSIFAKDAMATGELTSELAGLVGLPAIAGLLHYASALGMFLILGYFSFFVFTEVQTDAARGEVDGLTEVKRTRNRLYRIAGALIFFAIGALIVKVGLESVFLKDAAQLAFKEWWNGFYLTFLFEALALIAFGVSWLVKARIFGWLEDTGHA